MYQRHSQLGILPTDVVADVVGKYGAAQGKAGVDNCIRPIPSFCSYLPFSDLFDACQPYNYAELSQLSTCMAGPVAKVNPDLAAQGIANAAAIQKVLQKPENTPASYTSEYNAAVNNPTLSAVFGPSLVAQFGGGSDPNTPIDWTKWAVIAAGIAGVVLLTR